MVVVTIILGWMLANMWIALIWCKLEHIFISEWDEYFELFVVSIISIPVLLLIKGIVAQAIKLKKKFTQRNKSEDKK